jgi:hypothetical protein
VARRGRNGMQLLCRPPVVHTNLLCVCYAISGVGVSRLHNKSSRGNATDPSQGIGGRSAWPGPTGLPCGGRGGWSTALFPSQVRLDRQVMGPCVCARAAQSINRLRSLRLGKTYRGAVLKTALRDSAELSKNRPPPAKQDRQGRQVGLAGDLGQLRPFWSDPPKVRPRSPMRSGIFWEGVLWTGAGHPVERTRFAEKSSSVTLRNGCSTR